jgi:hypothetical protein
VPETKCEDLVREICLHTTIGVDRRGGLFFYDSRGDQIKREVRLALLPNHAKKHPPPAISSVAAPSMPSPPCAVRACLHENSHWSDWLGGALRCEPDPAPRTAIQTAIFAASGPVWATEHALPLLY